MTTRTAPTPMLDEQLCFALYAASRRITAAYRPLLDPLGLTYPQYLAMLVLWEADRTSVRALGARLQLDSGTLSPLLKRLEQAGLLRRERRRSDEREVEISLTPAGRKLRSRAADTPREITRRLRLSAAACARLREELHSLAASLSAPTPRRRDHP